MPIILDHPIARYPQMFDAAVLVQAMGGPKPASICSIQTVDWATQVSLYAGGKYQAMSFGFSAKMDPSPQFDLLIGDKAKDARKVWDSEESRRSTSKRCRPAIRRRGAGRLRPPECRFPGGRAGHRAVQLAAHRRVCAPMFTATSPGRAAQQRLWNVGIR